MREQTQVKHTPWWPQYLISIIGDNLIYQNFIHGFSLSPAWRKWFSSINIILSSKHSNGTLKLGDKSLANLEGRVRKVTTYSDQIKLRNWIQPSTATLHLPFKPRQIIKKTRMSTLQRVETSQVRNLFSCCSKETEEAAEPTALGYVQHHSEFNVSKQK